MEQLNSFTQITNLFFFRTLLVLALQERGSAFWRTSSSRKFRKGNSSIHQFETFLQRDRLSKQIQKHFFFFFLSGSSYTNISAEVFSFLHSKRAFSFISTDSNLNKKKDVICLLSLYLCWLLSSRWRHHESNFPLGRKEFFVFLAKKNELLLL